MTIRAFADKYGLSKATAYGAASTVFPHATEERNVDFDEDELFNALMEYLDGKKEKAWNRYMNVMKMITEVKAINAGTSDTEV